MSPASRPRPPYLQKRIMRNGETAWYVRLGRGPLIRIRGGYNTPEFNAAYIAAVNGEKPQPKGAPAKDTLAWLLALYRASLAWEQLAKTTRQKRDAVYVKVIDGAGTKMLSTIDKQAIIDGRDRRMKQPSAARHFVDAMRALFRWAVERNLVKVNPAEGVKTPKQKGSGFPVWTEAEIGKFEARWPRGTRERVMFDVFIYTGLRISDAARLGKQHVKNGAIVIDTQKTATRITLPILPPLRATLNAGPVGDLAFIADAKGRPLLRNSVGNAFRAACRAAGVHKSPHGLRKAAATRAAEQGATVAELEAIFGWVGGAMASHYTRSADRKGLAARSANKLLPQVGAEVAMNENTQQNQVKK